MARHDAYTIPITERISAVWPHAATPAGTTGISQRITPKIPIFSIMPDNNIVPCVGAVLYVSGCQVWKGNTGIFTAKAAKIAQKINPCSAADKLWPAAYNAFKSNECAP